MMKIPGKILLITLPLVILLASCRGSEVPATTTSSAAPPDRVQMLMLTYETVFEPDTRTMRFQISSDGSRVRLGNEAEQWRLFDTTKGTITFVDEIAKTARTVTYDQALTERTALIAQSVSETTPDASVVDGPGEPDRGHPTRKVSISVGNFKRDLILSEQTLLPSQFFAMKIVTDPMDPKHAGIMRDVMPTLLRQTGTLISEINVLTFSEGETVSATTTLVSVNTIPLTGQTFELPEGIAFVDETAAVPATTTAVE